MCKQNLHFHAMQYSWRAALNGWLDIFPTWNKKIDSFAFIYYDDLMNQNDIILSTVTWSNPIIYILFSY